MKIKNFLFINLTICLLTVACVKENTGIIPDDPIEEPSSLPERIIKDTAYGANPKQTMDIYLPAGRNSSTKVIVMVHGGAWVSGDKSDLNNFVTLFRVKWPTAAIVNLNYRFANGTTILYHEIMSDLKQAINTLITNKSSFQISDKLALFGNSAGGHLVLMYAYTNNKNENIKAVADLYGPSQLNDWSWLNEGIFGGTLSDWVKQLTGQAWNEDLYKSLSPISYVTASSVPTAIFHATGDILVPVRQSQKLKEKLSLFKVPVFYKEYALGTHTFIDIDNDDCATNCVNFFKTYMK